MGKFTKSFIYICIYVRVCFDIKKYVIINTCKDIIKKRTKLKNIFVCLTKTHVSLIGMTENRELTCFQYTLISVKTKPRSITDNKSLRKKARLVLSLSTSSRS